MKTILKLTALLLIGSTLVAAECTSEKKAQMIMNGIEQSVIDSMCAPKKEKESERPIQVIINNSSNANNANTNTIANTNTPAYSESLPMIDYIEKDRLYIGMSYAIMQGTETTTYSEDYYDDEFDIDSQPFSLTLGYVFDSNNRFEIALTQGSYDYSEYSDSGYDMSGFDINYIWTLGSKNVKIGSFRPYILFGLGGYTLADDNDEYSTSVFSLGAGVSYSMSDSLEIDLGYHLKAMIWEELTYGTITATTTTGISGLRAALRLKF